MNKTKNILAKYFSGNCSPEESKAVEEQLAVSEDFRQEYESVARVWELTNLLTHDASLADAAWGDFEANVKAPKKTLGFDWLKVAASIIILAAFSVALFSYLNKDNSYTTGDDLLNVELADRSSVVLSDHSKIKASKNFETNRTLLLEGEAFFDVQKANSTFSVQVNGARIDVTGTQFNVFNLPNSNYVAVELYEGSVNFVYNNKIHPLTAGNRLELLDNELIVLPLKNTTPSWFNAEEINMINVSLMHIMLELQKTYAVEFKLPKRKLKERYTVALPKDDLKACLELISEISDINLKLDNNLITAQ